MENEKMEKKLPLKVKLAVTCGYLGNNTLILMLSYFLLYYYTDVVQISAAAATVILAAARVWDAVNDPMMGVIVDSTKSKEGRSRFWLKYFAIPSGIILFLTFAVPDVGTTGKVIWCGVTYILLGMAQTAVSVPNNALISRMTESRSDRTTIGQFYGIVSAALNFAVPAVTLPLVKTLGGGDNQKGFAIIGAILGTIFAVCWLITWRGTKGYDPSTAKKHNESENRLPNENKEEKIKVKDMLKVAVTNKYCIAVCAARIFYLLLNGIMGTTIVYYFTYNLKNAGLLSKYSLILTVGSIIPIFLMQLFLRRFGNAKSCVIGVLICGLGCLVRLVTMDHIIIVMMIGWTLMGFGSAMMANHEYQCILDATSYGKLKTHTDTSGIIMSLYTFSQKLGQALGSVIAAGLLALVPYVPNASSQDNSVLHLFFTENIIIPLAVSLICAVFFCYVAKLEKELMQMKKTESETEEKTEKVVG